MANYLHKYRLNNKDGKIDAPEQLKKFILDGGII